jgi:hypothetical protein
VAYIIVRGVIDVNSVSEVGFTPALGRLVLLTVDGVTAV